MKFSVITVCRNAERLIEPTIQSVLSQKFTDYEYIVIDGLSTDATVDVINKYIKEIDYFVSERDSGIYNAMNKAIANARGDYCIFINAGDSFHDPSVLNDISRIDGNKDIVFGDIIVKSSKKEKLITYSDLLTPYYLYANIICHQCQFIKRSLFSLSTYNEKYSISADYEFLLSMIIKNNASYIHVNRTIAYYLDDASHSVENRDKCLAQMSQIQSSVFSKDALCVLDEYHSFRITLLVRLVQWLMNSRIYRMLVTLKKRLKKWKK